MTNNFKNIKPGDILSSKTTVEIIKSSSIDSQVTIAEKFDGKNYELKIIGTIKDMATIKSTKQILLDFIEKQEQFNNSIKEDIHSMKSDINLMKSDIKDIKSRLNVLESFHKDDIEKSNKK